MKIDPIKTQKIIVGGPSLLDIIQSSITECSERSILIITSKIISLCEGRVIKIGERDKQSIIQEESSFYIPPVKSKYDISLTITRNILIPTAGIDESNGNGYYVLWPSNPQQTARDVRAYLADRFRLTNVGVLITDSKTSPLRLGTTGICLAYAGFSALKNYIDTPDLFGRYLKVTKANFCDGLAAAAVLVMGEGNEQTPLAMVEDIPFVRFDESMPTESEIHELYIPLADDMYSPLIATAPWEKGKK